MDGAAGRKCYEGNLGKDDLSEFIGTCVQILFVTSRICLTVLVGFSGQLSKWLALDKHWILLAVLVTAANIIIQLRLGQWQVRKQALKYGTLQISQSLLNVVLSLALVVVLLKGADGRISAQI